MVKPQWDFVKEVKVIDDLTVDVVTNEPWAYFEHDVSYNGCELLPPGYVEEVGDEAFAMKPVGSGPYKLTEFIASERYVFDAWDDYHSGRPEVDRVVYQVIPEAASQVAALLAGQVDMVNNVPLPDRENVCNAPGIKCTPMTSDRLQHLLLRSEMESGGMAEEYPGYEPPLMDQNLRHAVSHALDRNLLAEVQGSAYPTLVRIGRYYPEGFGDKYHGPDAVAEWYDPELAKELIKEAGYDPDAGDKPMVYFDAPNLWYGSEKEVAEAATLMLEEVGFEVELNVLDKSAYLEQVHSPGLNRGIELGVKGGSPSLTPLFYQCDWWDRDYHVCIEEWDALNKQILSTVDPDERLALWEKFWDYYLDWGGQVDLLEVEYTYAINEEFEWMPRADGWVTFRDLKINQ
jgi:peptide/nickel transport system substrate-binding protein